MKILLNTNNQETKNFFRNYLSKEIKELVITENISEEYSLDSFDIIVFEHHINYFKQKNFSKVDLNKLFVIIDNTSEIDDLVSLGIFNILTRPLDEKLVKVQFWKNKNQLLKVQSLISEIKKKEKNEAKLEKTLQLMPDGVIMVDKNAIIKYTNAQVENLFGYKPEELIGKDIETVVPMKYRGKHIGFRDNYIKNPKIRPMGSQLDVLGLRKDDSVFPVDISLSPIRIEDEFFIVSTIKDITDRKNIQLELNKTKEIAEAANRAKTEFLANMSHELRTPLNAILGYSQILLRDGELNNKQKEEIKIIKSSGENLLSLISDILNLSKIESGTMELNPVEFILPEFLEGVVDIFKIRANEKGLSFHFELLSDLPFYVYSDEKKLRQILFNLLSNSLKFTEKGGIALKVGEKPENIVNSTDSFNISFQVEDTGIGIESDKQNEIFQPFTQVSSQSLRAEGTGLGLSISQKLANILNSEIKLKSKAGDGSIFFFDVNLPEVKKLNISPELNEEIITGYKGARKKILVVDDKWENRSVLTNLLSPLDFIIFEAIDGLDGFNKCVKYKPDLIFLDLRMPNLDGFETTRKIRLEETVKNTIIIAVSASAFEVDKESSIEAGCNDFIAKPFRQEKVFQILAEQLKLDWMYEDSSNEGIVEIKEMIDFDNLPELFNQETEKIKKLALIGDVDEIIKILEELENSETKFLPTIKYIKSLVQNFEFEKINSLLQ